MPDVFFVGDTGTATVDWVDAAGNEDTVAVGSDSWSSDDPNVATAATSADSLSGDIVCVGVGNCKISVVGTNKADGVQTNPASIDFVVNSADAAAGSISVTKNAPAPAPEPEPVP